MFNVLDLFNLTLQLRATRQPPRGPGQRQLQQSDHDTFIHLHLLPALLPVMLVSPGAIINNRWVW